jgi:hypothetical protein
LLFSKLLGDSVIQWIPFCRLIKHKVVYFTTAPNPPWQSCAEIPQTDHLTLASTWHRAISDSTASNDIPCATHLPRYELELVLIVAERFNDGYVHLLR